MPDKQQDMGSIKSSVPAGAAPAS
ncbi:MAG: hypothetical protein ACD_23C00429G0002, partial [uncultured bacterium]